MDFSHYTDEPVEMAVDLVNTYEAFTDVETLGSPQDIATFMEEHAAGWPHADWEFSYKDLHEIRALRSRLRQVLVADDADAMAEHLNAILVDVEAIPRVSMHQRPSTPGPSLPHLHFEPTGAAPARWLGAVTAMGLSVALIEGGIDRFGTCGSSTCDDAYIDTSRNRSRRHCSDTCATRENVAAYRARQRA